MAASGNGGRHLGHAGQAVAHADRAVFLADGRDAQARDRRDVEDVRLAGPGPGDHVDLVGQGHLRHAASTPAGYRQRLVEPGAGWLKRSVDRAAQPAASNTTDRRPSLPNLRVRSAPLPNVRTEVRDPLAWRRPDQTVHSVPPSSTSGPSLAAFPWGRSMTTLARRPPVSHQPLRCRVAALDRRRVGRVICPARRRRAGCRSAS